MAGVRRAILIVALLLWGGDWSLLARPDRRRRVDRHGLRSDRPGGPGRRRHRDQPRHQSIAQFSDDATTAATSFQGLAPGAYRLHVELTGFRPLTREGVGLATGETVRVDLQLQRRRPQRIGDGQRRRVAAAQRRRPASDRSSTTRRSSACR